ncbi:MAG: DUF1080 domain-containing protein [Bryobacterales bacterium]|nr:DUF1080 domain-containing protein [Bryobacterales bacterium]
MRVAAILLVFLSALAPAFAQSKAPQGPLWEPLFNGKDLTGWTVVGPERWSVQDGMIVGEGIHGKNGFLKTLKTYKDFYAFLRFKCETPLNSGFFFHSDLVEDLDKISFIQVEISTDINGHTAGLHGDNTPELKGKSWIALPAPENEIVVRPFDWNELLVMVEGNHIRTRLNGVDMIDLYYADLRNKDGIIALQIHSGKQYTKILFKDLYIRDLTVR